MDEVRLLESRKSARLSGSLMDFSKLADVDIVGQRRRMNSEASR